MESEIGTEAEKECGEDASVVVAVSEYKLRVKNLQEKVDKKELDGLGVLREPRQSMKEVEQLGFEN